MRRHCRTCTYPDAVGRVQQRRLLEPEVVWDERVELVRLVQKLGLRTVAVNQLSIKHNHGSVVFGEEL